MNLILELRKRVVTPSGKMRFGSQSRLAALLGESQDVIRKIVLGDRELTPEQSIVLRKLLVEKVPLFTVKLPTVPCDEPNCKKPGYAKGKCKRHYYLAWRRGIQTV